MAVLTLILSVVSFIVAIASLAISVDNRMALMAEIIRLEGELEKERAKKGS